MTKLTDSEKYEIDEIFIDFDLPAWSDRSLDEDAVDEIKGVIITHLSLKKKQWQEEAYIKGYQKGSGKILIDNTALVEDLFKDINPKKGDL